MKIVNVLLVAIFCLVVALALPQQLAADLLPKAAQEQLKNARSHFSGMFQWIGFSETNTSESTSSLKLAQVQARPISSVISTTGTLTPVALVNVSSLVSGQISQLLVDFNTDVKKGDPLAAFDPTTFQNALTEAEAELAIGQANVLKAQIALREAEADVQRKRTLFASGSGALTEQSKSIATRDLAAANLLQANATVKKGQAAVSQAQTNLDRAIIRSPIAGTIINRNVEIGQVLAVSLAVPTLFTIAKDLKAMELNALVSEGDIGRVRVGQGVTFTVDTFPGRDFKGVVSQIRKQPQSSQNVVLYTVIVDTPNPERLLLPGMTATTRIVIDERPPALSVPNAALRVRVSESLLASPSRVFVERQGRVVPITVKSLAADTAFTQIESEDLRTGDQVVVGLQQRGVRPTQSRGLVGGF